MSMERLYLTWSAFAFLVFGVSIFLGIRKRSRNNQDSFSLVSGVLSSILTAVFLCVIMFFLTYIGEIPYERNPILRYVNWGLPFVWILFSIYAWSTGLSAVERYAPGAALLGSMLIILGTNIWTLTGTRILIAALIVLGLIAWGRSRRR